ncbi:hypothetical protein L2E82_10725 [Cichorium intybus]|uniref:Uncharacterized protein n=1 Tax=Cichorium intybus TaxID=13427 RepID=A0ACB9GBH2_CICIN|nr:hypothetical protein L2E82_10725 [Cichorium intybus]
MVWSEKMTRCEETATGKESRWRGELELEEDRFTIVGDGDLAGRGPGRRRRCDEPGETVPVIEMVLVESDSGANSGGQNDIGGG